MPQFDFYCYNTQSFWVLIFFFLIYFIFYYFLLIKASGSLKLRVKFLNFSNRILVKSSNFLSLLYLNNFLNNCK
jgi:hypothetical protein